MSGHEFESHRLLPASAGRWSRLRAPSLQAGPDIMAPATIKVRWALPGGGSVKVEIAADADIDDLKQRIMAAAGIPSTLASLTDLHIGAERGINHWTATAQVLRNEASVFLPHGTVVVPVVRSLAAQTVAGVAGAYFAGECPCILLWLPVACAGLLRARPLRCAQRTPCLVCLQMVPPLAALRRPVGPQPLLVHRLRRPTVRQLLFAFLRR